MADVITGSTQVSATIEQVVASIVQNVLTAEAVMPPTIMDLSSMVGPGMDTLKIPRFANMTVGTKVSGTAAAASTSAFSTDDLPLNKHKYVQWLLEDIASLQSKVAITQAYVQQAAKDLAAELDLAIITELQSNASAAAPDHRIAYANSGTANTLADVDFIEARRLLNVQKVPLSGRTALIDPTQEANVLKISSFVKVNESGSEQALRNGLIGRVFGFDVIMSPQADVAKSMFYHQTAIVFARQLQPRYQTQPDLINLGVRNSVDHVYGVKTLDSGKRQVMVGTAA